MIILIAAMALVLAACGGSDDTGVASLEESTTTTAMQDDGGTPTDSDEDALLEFSACMRENGVEDFEDPTINADGSVEFGVIEGTSDSAVPDDDEIEKLEAAFETCGDLLEGVSFGGEDIDFTELEDTFVEFSACMRDNGVEVDDPNFSDASGIIDIFGDIDITDPDVQDALEECQEIFAEFAPGGTG
ncbi:MAG: hypothetical protein ACR2NG_04740 [Acidimicrobiia bacterium]